MKRLFLTSQFSAVTQKFLDTVPNTSGMKVAFIPTAADIYENKPWMESDRQALLELGMLVQECDIKSKTEEELYELLKEKDVIFVAGGNTFYLLYHAKQSGFDKAVSRLVAEGKLYIGSSAGSVLVGPTIEPVKTLDDPDDAPALKSLEGIGLVDFVVLPHYGNEKYEERYQSILEEWSGKIPLQLLKDDEAVLSEDEHITIL